MVWSCVWWLVDFSNGISMRMKASLKRTKRVVSQYKGAGKRAFVVYADVSSEYTAFDTRYRWFNRASFESSDTNNTFEPILSREKAVVFCEELLVCSRAKALLLLLLERERKKRRFCAVEIIDVLFSRLTYATTSSHRIAFIGLLNE